MSSRACSPVWEGDTIDDRESLIKDLNGEYENFFGVLMTLGDRDKVEVFLGTWSVRDIVAHMAAWLRVSSKALKRVARGERPQVPWEDGRYRDVDDWNGRWVEESRGKPAGLVEAELHAAKEQFVEAIRNLPEASVAEDAAIRRIIEETGANHFREHAAQVLAWKSRTGAGRPMPPGMPREAVG